MDPNDLPWLPSELLAKAIGTFFGTVIGLAVSDEPYTSAGVAKRVAVSIPCGIFLGDVLGEEWFGWSMIVPNRIIAASLLSAALGWWIVHALIRIAQAWQGKKAS